MRLNLCRKGLDNKQRTKQMRKQKKHCRRPKSKNKSTGEGNLSCSSKILKKNVLKITKPKISVERRDRP